MRVGLDLDGVIAEFVGPFLRRYNDLFGEARTREDVIRYSFDDAFGTDDGRCGRLIAQLAGDGFYAALDPVPGAVSCVRSIEARCQQVCVVTSRPSRLREETEGWMQRHGLCGLGLHFAAHGAKAATGPWDVFVEDSAEEASSLAETCQSVILMDAPWNRWSSLPRNVCRAYGWDEVLEIITRALSHSSPG